MTKFISSFLIIVSSLFVNQAFAISSCGSVTNFNELVGSGSCLTGPDNRITFTNFHTSVPRELWKTIKVSTIGHGSLPEGDGSTGVYSLTFDTTDVGIPSISFSFDVICDASCLINDGVYALGSNAGNGVWVINGQQQRFEDANIHTPTFSPHVRTLHQYAAFTQTAIDGLSPNYFSFGANIIPTGDKGRNDGTCYSPVLN